jgi:PTH1 family peptidyl-tRNA hydrolase
MNLSGKAVQYWMDKENIPLENIMAITDDLNLSLERFASKKGSERRS